jgi:hypothetical protein
MNNDYFLHCRTLRDLKNNVGLDYTDLYNVLGSNSSLEKAIIANPFIENDSEIVQVLSIVDSIIVGIVYYFPLRIKVNNKVYKASTGSRLFVYPPFRKNATLGIELVENAYNPNSYMFIAGGLTSEAVKIHQYYGAKEFVIPRYLLLNKSRSVLKAKLKIKGIILNLTSFFGDLILLFRRIILAIFIKIRLSNYNIEEVWDIPNEIEDIIATNPGKFQEHHDRKWFEWVLDNNFYNENSIKKHFIVVKDKRNSIIAFFMTQERNYEKISIFENVFVGSVIEWETKDATVLSEEMLSLLALMSFGKHIDVVEFATTSDKTIKLFKRIGLSQIGKRNMLVNIIPNKPGELFDGFDKIINWRIRPACGDTMMY